MIPKKVRKVLSILIAVTMVLFVVPAVVFADEENGLFGDNQDDESWVISEDDDEYVDTSLGIEDEDLSNATSTDADIDEPTVEPAGTDETADAGETDPIDDQTDAPGEDIYPDGPAAPSDEAYDSDPEPLFVPEAGETFPTRDQGSYYDDDTDYSEDDQDALPTSVEPEEEEESIWEDATYEWAEDKSTVTATHVLIEDESVVESETVETTAEITQQPTDEEPGLMYFTAVFSNTDFVTQHDIEEIPSISENVTYSGDASNPTWTKGSTNTLNIKFTRSTDVNNARAHFSGITIDGNGVMSKYYTKEGSITIKLKPSYLEGLSVGSHSIVVYFDDGQSSASFEVNQAGTSSDEEAAASGSTPDNSVNNTANNERTSGDINTSTSNATSTDASTSGTARTGDSSPIMPCVSLMLFSAFGIALTIKKRFS